MGSLSEQDLANMRKRIADKTKPSPVAEAVTPRAKGKTEPRDRGMNKTEAAYAQHLEGERLAGRIVAYKFESVKLRLADNTTLTPDFMVVDCDGFVQFHDCKAAWGKSEKPHIEDDASVKLKVAAVQYPYFTFKVVWRLDRTWRERTF